MATNRSALVWLILIIALLLAGHRSGETAPPSATKKGQAEQEARKIARDKKERLESLKKKLPDLATGLLKKVFDELVEIKEIKAEVKLARFIGPSEAKIILSCTIGVDDDFSFAVRQHFAIFLRDFDGQWTTTHIESSSKMSELSASLMLVIDQASAE